MITTKAINEMFYIRRAHSVLFDDYEVGECAYIGNSSVNNAVLGLVSKRPQDKVFTFTGIAVSAFCEATVQTPPFIACGRAGNGVVVLEPKTAMPITQLAYIASYINIAVRWRFSWYWQVTSDRIKHIPVPSECPQSAKFDVRSLLPDMSSGLPPLSLTPKFGLFVFGDLYEVVPGGYHSLGILLPGPVPIVSCGDSDNGIAGYFDVHAHLHQHKMTVACDGNTLTSKYHPYLFAAQDNVAVCSPRTVMLPTTKFYIMTILNNERWRYSYYRKCYMNKLKRFCFNLPTVGNQIDEESICQIVETTPYWPFLKIRFSAATSAPII